MKQLCLKVFLAHLLALAAVGWWTPVVRAARPIPLTTDCAGLPGIVGLWKMELSGNDSVGGHDGKVLNTNRLTVPRGSYFTNGPFACRALATGGQGGLMVASADDLQFGASEDLSMAAWIRLPTQTPTGASNLTILDKRSHGTNQPVPSIGYNFGLVRVGTNDGPGRPYRLECQLADAESFNRGVTNFATTNSFPLADEQWHHVAVSIDRTNRTGGRFFLNGQLVGVFDPTARQGDLANTQALWIGAHSSIRERNWIGSLDDVAIYRRALSEAELAQLYQAGLQAGCCRNVALSLSNLPTVNVNLPFSVEVFATRASGNSPSKIVVTNEIPSGLRYLDASTSKGTVTNLGNRILWLLGDFDQTNSYSLRLRFQAATNATFVFRSTLAYEGVVDDDPADDRATSTLRTRGVICTPLEGLLGWWPGNTSPQDIVGTNTARLVGPVTYQPGVVRSGFQFNGATTVLSLGTSEAFNNQDLSLEAWIKRDSTNQATANGTGGFFFAGDTGGYGFGLQDDGRLTFQQIGLSRVDTDQVITNTTTWHHVAVTKAGSRIVFYLNGAAISTNTLTARFIFTRPFAIGGLGGPIRNVFWGGIDELSLYGRALTPAELKTIFDAQAKGKCRQGLQPDERPDGPDDPGDPDPEPEPIDCKVELLRDVAPPYEFWAKAPAGSEVVLEYSTNFLNWVTVRKTANAAGEVRGLLNSASTNLLFYRVADCRTNAPIDCVAQLMRDLTAPYDFWVKAQPGATVTLEVSTNFANWTPLQRVANAAGEIRGLFNTNNPAVYYRIADCRPEAPLDCLVQLLRDPAPPYDFWVKAPPGSQVTLEVSSDFNTWMTLQRTANTAGEVRGLSDPNNPIRYYRVANCRPVEPKNCLVELLRDVAPPYEFWAKAPAGSEVVLEYSTNFLNWVTVRKTANAAGEVRGLLNSASTNLLFYRVADCRTNAPIDCVAQLMRDLTAPYDFWVKAQPGATVTLEVSTNFANWTPLQRVANAAGEIRGLFNTNNPAVYYRIADCRPEAPLDCLVQLLRDPAPPYDFWVKAPPGSQVTLEVSSDFNTWMTLQRTANTAGEVRGLSDPNNPIRYYRVANCRPVEPKNCLVELLRDVAPPYEFWAKAPAGSEVVLEYSTNFLNWVTVRKTANAAGEVRGLLNSASTNLLFYRVADCRTNAPIDCVAQLMRDLTAPYDFWVKAQPGATVTLEVSTNFANWTPLQRVANAAGEIRGLFNTNNPAVYYRIADCRPEAPLDCLVQLLRDPAPPYDFWVKAPPGSQVTLEVSSDFNTWMTLQRTANTAGEVRGLSDPNNPIRYYRVANCRPVEPKNCLVELLRDVAPPYEFWAKAPAGSEVVLEYSTNFLNWVTVRKTANAAGEVRGLLNSASTNLLFYRVADCRTNAPIDCVAQLMRDLTAPYDFWVKAQPGATVTLEVSTNFANWTPLQRVANAAGEIRGLFNTNNPALYYRVANCAQP